VVVDIGGNTGYTRWDAYVKYDENNFSADSLQCNESALKLFSSYSTGSAGRGTAGEAAGGGAI
jgi:hypothetical protein